MFGVTGGGGVSGACNNKGCGVAFALDPRKPKNFFYAFQGAPDAADPVGGLLNFLGTFYGVSNSGGTADLGTVYAINSDGNERVVYSFLGDSIGEYPVGNLIK